MKASRTIPLSHSFLLPLALALDPCIPSSHNYPPTSDTPAIQAAINTCGPSGDTILFPKGSTWTVHERLDFSPCRNCTVQVDGNLQLFNNAAALYPDANKPTLWFNGVRGARVTSSTGTGWIPGNAASPAEDAAGGPVFNVTGGSTGIRIENLKVEQPIGDFFWMDGASDVVFENLTLGWYHPPSPPYSIPSWLSGFKIASSSHVTIRNTKINYAGSCVVVKEGVSDLVVEDVEYTDAQGEVASCPS